MVKLLRQRNFALLWFGGLISLTGDRVLMIAVPFFVYQRTGSTLATAAMVAVELLPRFVFGSVAGVFADRWKRKKIMLLASLGQALVILPLLLVALGAGLWVVYLVSFLQRSLAMFFSPAETALLPTLVEGEDLMPANSLNALNNNLARMIGPPLGGMLLGMAGLPGVVLFDSLTFIAGAGLIALIRIGRPVGLAVTGAADAAAAASSTAMVSCGEAPPGAPETAGAREPHTGQVPAVEVAQAGPAGIAAEKPEPFWSRLRKDWLEGMAVVRKNRVVTILFMSVVILNLGGVMMDPLWIPYMIGTVGIGPETIGWLMTARAIGGITGGLLAAHLSARTGSGKRLSLRGVYGWAEVALALVLLIEFNVPHLTVVFVTVLVSGLPGALGMAALETLFQQTVPNTHLGRVSGTLETTMAVVALLGVMGLSGVLGEVIGVVAVLNIAVVITMANGWFVLAFLRR